MSGVSSDVAGRLEQLRRYNELAPKYCEAVAQEDAARDERLKLEDELRAISELIGRDPAGILPRRRRAKGEGKEKPKKADTKKPPADKKADSTEPSLTAS